MKKAHKKLSRDIGLEIGSILGKYFLDMDHLHYGYWTDDLKLDIANLPKAQQRYTEFLISNIPDGVRMVLDVGCGTGANAVKLAGMGYRVDCLSPSRFQCDKVRELCGDTVRVFEGEYERFETQDRYDMILFSESFQYIALDDAVAKSWALLNDQGYLLICDIFRKAARESMAMRGGHDLKKFHEAMARYPFRLIADVDITEAAAPNIDLQNDMMTKVVKPILLLVSDYLDTRYSFTSRVVRWAYRKQIERKYNKYFGEERTGEEFRKSREYRLLLYRKADVRTAL
jgi:SAM-dependent methyltransferase